MTKSMILPCLLSGLFGAIFAAACGVVDGVKEANANSVALIKEVYEYDCIEGEVSVGEQRCPSPPFREMVDYSKYPIIAIYYECNSGEIDRYEPLSSVGHCNDEGDFEVKKIITFIH
tara:strand:- start:1448 stop:1798 length:351 start_codon:yes stop_codon:yes gene_type:complete